MNIITSAFEITAAVEKFRIRVRNFFYKVMLMCHSCPKCNGSLTMIAEGLCKCNRCSHEFDPTVEFQRCLDCGGTVVLRVRRYCCKTCGIDITSRFLFDGLVYDRDYFAQKMTESRQRKKEQREYMHEMAIENRSDTLALEATDLNSVPGLVDALNGLTQGIKESKLLELKQRFDLNRYQDHVNEYVGEEPIDIREIPPIIENLRLDLIWRFIATIFLEHYGQVDIEQQQDEILVTRHAY